MDHDAVNDQIRKLLKQFGVTSQQELERSLGAAVETGALSGDENLAVRMTLEVDGLDLRHTVSGEVKLDGKSS